MLQCIFRLCVRVLKLGYNGVQRVGGVFGVVFGGGGQFFRRRRRRRGSCFFLFFWGRFLVAFLFLGVVFWSLFWTRGETVA